MVPGCQDNSQYYGYQGEDFLNQTSEKSAEEEQTDDANKNDIQKIHENGPYLNMIENLSVVGISKLAEKCEQARPFFFELFVRLGGPGLCLFQNSRSEERRVGKECRL